MTPEIRVEVESERAISHDPARVLVYEDDRLVTEVIAKIELEPGADGGYYHCVKLKKREGESGSKQESKNKIPNVPA